MADFISEFRTALAQAGIPCDAEIIEDGNIHRYKTEGDDNPNCWYSVHNYDRFCVAAFGCWKRGINDKWNSTNGTGTLSGEELAAMRKAQREAEQIRRTEQERIYYEARKTAQQMLSAASEVLAHPYLERKRVGIHGRIRVNTENILLLPLCDVQGSIHSLQFIDPNKQLGKNKDREKGFLFGGKIVDCFYVIDNQDSGPLVICEGYATGATIFEATGWATYCAMNSTNLPNVAKVLRKAFPHRLIIIAADNDRFTHRNNEPYNAGVEKGREAAEAIKGYLAFPEFPDSDLKSSDFNDLAHAKGLDSVKALLESILPLPTIIDAADFIRDEIPLPDELIKGVLYRGNKLVLGGGSKTFKTWTLFDLSVAIAHGLHWLGFETIQGRVLYVNFEIPPAFFQRRLKAILTKRELELQRAKLEIWNLRGHAGSHQILIPKLIDYAAKRNYSLIVLDPIYKLYGDLNENSASDVAKLLNSLEDLADSAGAAIAYGAHYSKGNQALKEAVDRISGSGVFARDPDSMLSFTKHEQPNSFTVDLILRNHTSIEPFVVTWDYPMFKRANELDPEALKLPRKGGRAPTLPLEEILTVLRNTSPIDPLTQGEVAKRASVSKSSVSRVYVPRMLKAGYIKESDQGRGYFITLPGVSFLDRIEETKNEPDTPPQNGDAELPL